LLVLATVYELANRPPQIDKFPLHTVIDEQTASRLSDAERQYTMAHQALVSSHYHSSFLSEFPAALQRLDDTAGGISMIDTPDVDAAVFCRVLRDVGRVRQDATDSEFDMKKGDVWVVRWSLIRDRVFEGDIELI
jgi:GINS complex subunit 4